MNTPAHLIFAAAAFARPHERPRTIAALAGALAPDLSLYLMAGISLFVLGYSPGYVFDTLYFSDAWQMVFKIDNSFILWGIGLGLAWWFRSTTAMVFAGAGLLHLAFDFPLHHDDGRAHFWPLSDWVFHSPVSYWDRQHYGDIVGPIEMLVSFGFCILLFFRFGSLRSRAVICVAAAMQLAPVFFWVFIFATGGT
ncbi:MULTISPECIES: cobalamin biosynthesis protein CobQ [unclassified Roseovarius]|uniref:cobalamin biosynthesis protein CobQ n=1 Tax=unclassified Roseovarius TaxID=2614913 RepID=UPI00273EE0B4|nr:MULTISPECIES: cobalamin biosynthesis protein CobQ [unclassified Roseovarius]